MSIEQLSQEKNGLSVTFDDKQGPYASLNIELGGKVRSIPVFSVRDAHHHEAIARSMVSGKIVLFEVGVVGLMIAVNNSIVKEDNGRKFWELKKGRSPADKVPIMMSPEDYDGIVNFDMLHKDYHYLKDPTRRQEFFGALPFHTIFPLKENSMNINGSIFVTTLEDMKKKPSDQSVSVPTICIYFQGGDKAWKTIAGITKLLDPNIYLGISSFNDHGEQSPYDFNELIAYCNRKQRVDFDYVVRDPIVAKHKIKSSMTQIRLPLRGETPEIIIVRKGPVSGDMLRRHTGHPVRELASARFASHGHPEDVRLEGLEDRIMSYLSEVKS